MKPVIPDESSTFEEDGESQNGVEEEERAEVGIKDWKPDVNVKYKGQLPRSLLLEEAGPAQAEIFRFRNFVSPAGPDH